MARMKATVEPLPWVPATWITGGSRRSGWPRAASSRSMRPSDRSIALGCSPIRRSRMGWTRFMRSIGHRRVRAVARLGRRGQLQQQQAEPRQRGLQLVTVHDHVDHAVLQQIFGALEAFGQLLPYGLLDDARPRET